MKRSKIGGFEVIFFICCQNNLKKINITFTHRTCCWTNQKMTDYGMYKKPYLKVKSDEDPCLDKMSISVGGNEYWWSKCVSSAAANSYTEACTPSWQSASIGTEKTAARLQPSSSKVGLYSSYVCLSVFWHNMVLIVKLSFYVILFYPVEFGTKTKFLWPRSPTEPPPFSYLQQALRNG